MSRSKPVVLFVIDGMRSDALAQAETPCMDDLMAASAHSLPGQTAVPSMTLPSHALIF
jgi:predicted AlkP superfamily pyrophosphatase or phosphodiesterase